MYCRKNYRYKKQMLADFKAGIPVPVFQPGLGGIDGQRCIEGPHYVAHTWYASVSVKNGVVVEVLR